MQAILKLITILWLIAATLVFTSCSSTPAPSQSGTVTTQAAFETNSGYGGQLVVAAIATTNIVVSLDSAARKIGLRAPDGKFSTYTAGAEVVNFGQIKVGEQVRATVVEEMAVNLIPANSPQKFDASAVVARAPSGARPGARSLETITFTAKVLSINAWQDQVTLQLPDGQTKTVGVREAINLADFQPGDEVRVRLTQALAVLVENP